jgi:N-acetylglucosamine malate deacetylase 2
MKKSYRATTTHALAWLRDAAAAGLWRAEAARVDAIGNPGNAILGTAAPAAVWTASGAAGYVDAGGVALARGDAAAARGGGAVMCPVSDKVAQISPTQLFSHALDCRGDGVALVVAHPDDEVIGLGGHLAMLQRGIQVIHLNSGSVDNDVWPRKCGFTDRYVYRAKRAAELAEVLRLSGIAPEQWCSFDIPDLEAPFHLVASIERLARIFAQHDTRLVFTHAYEGGNPDHDACAFIVWAAVSLLESDIPILEMPYYRQWAYAWLRPRLLQQSFIPNGESVYGRLLTPEQREQKRRLLAVYQSQAEALRHFSVEREYFRRARPVQGLPNNGRLALYKEAGLPAEQWLRLMSSAQRALALAAPRSGSC